MNCDVTECAAYRVFDFFFLSISLSHSRSLSFVLLFHFQAITLGTQARLPQSFDQFAAIIEYLFIIVMIIENLSKFLACGWKEYIRNVWCLIDLFNTVVSGHL